MFVSTERENFTKGFGLTGEVDVCWTPLTEGTEDGLLYGMCEGPVRFRFSRPCKGKMSGRRPFFSLGLGDPMSDFRYMWRLCPPTKSQQGGQVPK